jgi:hypothetical protein
MLISKHGKPGRQRYRCSLSMHFYMVFFPALRWVDKGLFFSPRPFASASQPLQSTPNQWFRRVTLDTMVVAHST